MALPEHYTGSNGIISIDTVVQTIAKFSVDVKTDVVVDYQIGEENDRNYPGKKHVTGMIEETLTTGDNFAMLLGDTSSIATSSLETLLAATNLDAAAREELPVTSDPTSPTSVKCTLGVGDAVTTAGSIVIHGTDSNDNDVTEVISFDAMAVGDSDQVVQATQIFKTTDFVTIAAALESGAASYSTIKLEGVDGVKTITLGESTYFDLVGKVEDINGKYWQISLTDCWLTAGTFPIGDKNAIVKTALPFTVKNAGTTQLAWTAT